MNSSRRKPQNPEVRRILGLPPENDVDEGAVDAAEKTAAAERFEKIYQAVRHGAFDHDLGMSNDMMFLCERIVELEAQSAATGKRAAVYLQNAIELQARVEDLEAEVADKQNVIDPLAIQVERDEIRIAELENKLEEAQAFHHRYAAVMLVQFTATVCADPDGLPNNPAWMQRAAEIFAESMAIDFDIEYREALNRGSFKDTEKVRARLRTKAERDIRTPE